MDLPLMWFSIIAFGVLVYVVLDGFDLGVSILFPFLPDQNDRSVAMQSIVPVWDGNETWLVLGGAALFAAFPKAYAVLLSTLYLPISFMLLPLVLRGVAFEFRFKSTRHKPMWDMVFAAGSTSAGFFQGIVLGAIVQGIPEVNGLETS